MNWQQWKAKYHRELEHIAGYEEKFVDLVLMNIPNLQPTDVIPQYHFKDSSGKNRYIDFMIISQHKNWLLPIELDGYAKMVGNGNDYERFTDFLERQNAMIKQFGLVLRYTNKAMFNQSPRIISEIADTLYRQSQDKSTRDIQEANTKQMMSDYEHKIAQLQANNNNHQNQEILTLLSSTQNEIKTLKQSKPIENEPIQSEFKSKLPYAIGLVFIAVIGLIGLYSSGLFTKPVEEAPSITEEKIVYVPQEPIIVEREVVKEVPVYVDVEAPEYKPEPVIQSNPIEAEALARVQLRGNEAFERITGQTVEQYQQEQRQNRMPTAAELASQYHDPSLNHIKTFDDTLSLNQGNNKYTVGKVVNVCGVVSEVRYNQSNGNNYLNINGKYPNQEITFTVWINEDLSYYTGKTICTYGDVQEYKGRLSINVNSLKGLKEK